jgi:DNA-binding Lrp family transcriptional regulator
MLDVIDRKLLGFLQADGKLSNQDLAERTSLSAPACWRRVRRLEEAGVIRQYVALLDGSRVGFGLLVFAFVDLENHHADTVADFDHIVAADMQAYEEFLRLRLLPNRSVRSVNTSFSMNAKKLSTALPIDGIAPRPHGRYHGQESKQSS